MAGSGVTLYSTTSAGNKTVIGTIDWREDVYMPAQINDNVAQIMADIRAMANAIGNGYIEIGDTTGTYTATYVSATSFRFDGVDVTNYYRAGMRIFVIAPTPVGIAGTITSSVFATHTTITVAWDGAGLSNEAITAVQIGVGSGVGAGGQSSFRNIAGRNGGFEIWQRGAGGSAAFAFAAGASGYTADGWFFACSANQASLVTQQPGIAAGSNFSVAIARNAGQTGTTPLLFEFPLDTDEIAKARNNIVTLSLTMLAGANFSPSGGNVTVSLYTGTGNPAKRQLGTYTGEVIAISTVQAITATATRYSFSSTAAIGSSVASASIVLNWTPFGTAGASDYLIVDDVQLAIAGGSTAFERPPRDQELLACKRHFFKTFAYGTAPATSAGAQDYAFNAPQPVAASTAFDGLQFPLPVEMRSAPSVTLYNTDAANAQIRNIWGSSDCTGTAAAASTRAIRMTATTPAGIGAGSRLAVHAIADAGI